MVETWYFRTGTGAACGPGTRRPLIQSAGTTPSTQDIASEHTWNRTETARSIAAGNWSVILDVTTGTGGGQPNRVTAVVERRNSSCVVQQTILNVQSGNLTAGTTEEVTLTATGVAQVNFSSGDILTVRVVRSQGTRSQTLRFDDDPATDADSRLTHPDEAVLPVFEQTGFRARNDDGTETTATWKANENVNWSQAVDENFRVRFIVQETNGGVDSNWGAGSWEYNLNSGGWNAVTASSSVVRLFDSPNFASGDNTTDQIGGTGTFAVGEMQEATGTAGHTNFAANNHSEWEVCCQIISGDVVNNDSIQLRIVNNNDGTPVTAWPTIPTITVSEGGGTEYTQSVDGTLTTAGALLKQGQPVFVATLSPSGVVSKQSDRGLTATLTTAGALAKEAQKVLAATLTTAGALTTSRLYSETLAATLTTAGDLIKEAQKTLDGTLTSAGTLVNQAQKMLSGTLTTAGNLVKQAQRVLDGTISPTGALTNQIQRVLTATLTPSGALSKQTQRALTATLATVGDLIKQAQKLFAGTLTTSGELDASRVSLVSLTGTLTTAGNLVKQAGKNLTATLTTSGNLIKQVSRLLDGTLTTTGALVNQAQKLFSGVLSTAGTLTKQAQKLFTGTLTSAGVLVKQAQKLFTATLTTAGDLIKQAQKTLSGAISTITGALSTVHTPGGPTYTQAVAGTLTTAGNLVKETQKSLTATLSSAGALVNQAQKALSATLTSAGNLVKETQKTATGVLTSAGSLIKQTRRALSAAISSLVGALSSIHTPGGAQTYFQSIAGTCTFSGSLSVVYTAGVRAGGIQPVRYSPIDRSPVRWDLIDRTPVKEGLIDRTPFDPSLLED